MPGSTALKHLIQNPGRMNELAVTRQEFVQRIQILGRMLDVPLWLAGACVFDCAVCG
jgi:hypothetical protein